MSSNDTNSVLTEKDAISTALIETNTTSTLNLLPLIIICVFLMIVGVIGNVLVIYVYWCKMKSSAKRTFILTLAMLDLGVCSIVIPFEIYDLMNQALFHNDAACKVMRFFEYTTVLSAGFVLVSVSFERYYFICKAFNDFTGRKARVICFACLCIAILIASPSTYFAGSKKRTIATDSMNISGYECSMHTEDDMGKTWKTAYYCCLAAIFLICNVMFIILYSILGRLLWKYKNGTLVPGITLVSDKHKKESLESSLETSFESSQSRKIVNDQRKDSSARYIVVFFSVTVVFILSYLPHLVVRLILLLGIQLTPNLSKDSSELAYNFIVRSYLISKVANPFIYSILNRPFRKKLKHTFKNLHERICSILKN